MSILTDEVFRKARRNGLSDESSVFAVYEHGRVKADLPNTNAGDILARVKTIFQHYLQLKAAGYPHHDALDEVLLAGYRGEL